jgi:hypothetical protein
MELVAVEELRGGDPELHDAFDAWRRDRASRAERGEAEADWEAFRRQFRASGPGGRGDDQAASADVAAGTPDDGGRVEEYRTVWEELRAATSLAESLLREVPPEEMVGALAATSQPPAAVSADLYALLSWLRAVAAVAEHRERRRRALATLDGGAESPAPGGEPPLLGQPFQIKSGLLRHRRRESVEVRWRRPERPE